MTTTQLTGWDVYVLKENEKKRKLEEEAIKNADHPPLRGPEVVVEGHEIEDWSFLTRQTTVGKIAYLADEYGWTVKVGESQYRTADRMWKGAVREGKVEVFRWVQAISPDRKHHISVSAGLVIMDGWPIQDTEEVKAVDEVKIQIAEFGVER